MTDLRSAHKAYALADEQMLLAEAVERARGHRGLRHASLTGASTGPHAVAYDGVLLGEVHLIGPGSAVGCWTAHPYPAGHEPHLGSALPDDGHGPYVTLRAAAASLLRNRPQDS